MESGAELRATPWQGSRRRYDLSGAVQSSEQAALLLDFFEACRGRLLGFRFCDPMDHSSAPYGQPMSPTDQILGRGDGQQRAYQLVKAYGLGINAYSRKITKPVESKVELAVNGTPLITGLDFTVDWATGLVELGQAPAIGQSLTAGFEFDVPVRFDSDQLDLTWIAAGNGRFPTVPLVEILV